MRETVVVLTDDIDKTTKTNVETITFAIDGQTYEIELGKVNAGRLRKVYEPLIEAGRRVTHQANGHRHPRIRAQHSVDSARIREWAATQPDITLKPRGRVPEAVVTAYREAHNA
jgi:hypothetical protein